jgi:hypothetical protein
MSRVASGRSPPPTRSRVDRGLGDPSAFVLGQADSAADDVAQFTMIR